jgi:Tol biopolymer transport system component
VCLSVHDGRSHIYTTYDDGSDQRQLTSSPADDSDPVWSADGTKIAFTRTIAGPGSDVWVRNADGSGQRNLTRSLDPFERRTRLGRRTGSKIAFTTTTSDETDKPQEGQ